MTRRIMIFTALAAVALVVGTPAPAAAATEAELRERFKERYPELLKAKTDGKIGENTAGYVEAVDASDSDAQRNKLVQDENSDRRELYALIAEKEGTTADVVAKRNALRNYDKARPGEYLKKTDGTWGRKK